MAMGLAATMDKEVTIQSPCNQTSVIKEVVQGLHSSIVDNQSVNFSNGSNPFNFSSGKAGNIFIYNNESIVSGHSQVLSSQVRTANSFLTSINHNVLTSTANSNISDTSDR
jgi:hypothetical protein